MIAWFVVSDMFSSSSLTTVSETMSGVRVRVLNSWLDLTLELSQTHDQLDP